MGIQRERRSHVCRANELSVVLLEKALPAQEGFRSRIGSIVVPTTMRPGVEESVRRAVEE